MSTVTFTLYPSSAVLNFVDDETKAKLYTALSKRLDVSWLEKNVENQSL